MVLLDRFARLEANRLPRRAVGRRCKQRIPFQDGQGRRIRFLNGATAVLITINSMSPAHTDPQALAPIDLSQPL